MELDSPSAWMEKSWLRSTRGTRMIGASLWRISENPSAKWTRWKPYGLRRNWNDRKAAEVPEVQLKIETLEWQTSKYVLARGPALKDRKLLTWTPNWSALHLVILFWTYTNNVNTISQCLCVNIKYFVIDCGERNSYDKWTCGLSFLSYLSFFTVAGEKPQRRGSVGSLDSGMSISFQSTSASSMSQGIKHPGQVHPMHTGATIPGGAKGLAQQPSFLGGLFAKRERKLSQSEESGPYSRTTEV